MSIEPLWFDVAPSFCRSGWKYGEDSCAFNEWVIIGANIVKVASKACIQMPDTEWTNDGCLELLDGQGVPTKYLFQGNLEVDQLA